MCDWCLHCAESVEVMLLGVGKMINDDDDDDGIKSRLGVRCEPVEAFTAPFSLRAMSR